MLSSLAFFATLLGLGAPAALILIPWTIITRNASALYYASMTIVRAALWLARVRVEATGFDLAPAQTACLFMSNHVSNLDPPCLIPKLPGRTSAFIKRSLTKIPIFGSGLRLADFVPVDRDGRVESAQDSAAVAKRVLEKGFHLIVFVEGTRSRDGRMLPFKRGPFYLAMESGAPCVPISIHGTETMMAKGSLRMRPGTAHVVFHPPLWPRDFATREELMEAVRAAIAGGLPEWMRGASAEESEKRS
jgi:1-acyl-sn-glycerol-3-phosphate acyltransferase